MGPGEEVLCYFRDICIAIECSSTSGLERNLGLQLGACGTWSYRKWLATEASGGPTSGRPPLVPDCDSTFGWDRLGQVVTALLVRRPVHVLPQNAVLETPATNDLEYPNVTPEIALLTPILQGVLAGPFTGV